MNYNFNNNFIQKYQIINVYFLGLTFGGIIKFRQNNQENSSHLSLDVFHIKQIQGTKILSRELSFDVKKKFFQRQEEKMKNKICSVYMYNQIYCYYIITV